MTDIKGFTKASLSLDPTELDIQHTISADAEMSGGKMHFKAGARIFGSVTGCDEISCEGMLIIEKGAKIQAKLIRTKDLASMGDVQGEHCIVTGTLIAWDGTFHVTKIDYAAFEKSVDCVVKGSLDQIQSDTESFSYRPTARAAALVSNSVIDTDDSISSLRVVAG